MSVGRQGAIIAAVAFGIGISIGFTRGHSSSRHGRPTSDPVAHRAGVDAGRAAMASRETIAPAPPDAPEAIEAAPDAAPPEAALIVRDPSPPVIDGGVGKPTQPTQPIEPSKRKRNVQGGSKHKVEPSTPPVDPFGSPD
jgi:hypothetical protein